MFSSIEKSLIADSTVERAAARFAPATRARNATGSNLEPIRPSG